MPLARVSKPRVVAGLIVASAGLVLSVAACGGGSDATSDSTGTPGGGNTAFAAYTECLKTNGVTITMPSGGARVRPSDGAGRPSGQPGGMPSGMPRPSGSAGARGGGPGGGGFGAFSKPDNVSQDTWDKAVAACASVLPSMGPGQGNRGGGDGANAAYRNCLQENGVTLGNGAPNTTDPTFQKAEETCKVLRPAASATPTA